MINENWRIDSDDSQWIVQKCTGLKKKEWKNQAYYPSLKGAITDLYRRGVRSIDSDDPETIMKEMKKFQEEIKSALNQFDEVQIHGKLLSVRR